MDWANACARIPENWPLSSGTSDVDLRDRHGEAVQVRYCSIDALQSSSEASVLLELYASTTFVCSAAVHLHHACIA